jgi:hypothetical protein
MKIFTKLLFPINLGSSSWDQIEQNEKHKTPKTHIRMGVLFDFFYARFL